MTTTHPFDGYPVHADEDDEDVEPVNPPSFGWTDDPGPRGRQGRGAASGTGGGKRRGRAGRAAGRGAARQAASGTARPPLPQRHDDGAGTASGKGSGTAAARHAGTADEPSTYRLVGPVVPDNDRHAGTPVPARGKLAAAIGTWFDGFRFVSEDIGSLRKQLRLARSRAFNGSDIFLLHVLRVAFFFAFTAPAVTILFCIAWLILDPVRFASAFVINLPVSAVVNHVPVVEIVWPDFLDCTTWTTGLLINALVATSLYLLVAVIVFVAERRKAKRAGARQAAAASEGWA